MPAIAFSQSRTLPAYGAVSGVDVGFSPTRRSSAICRLDWTETAFSWTIERFRAVEVELNEVVTRVAGGRDILAAAFDGPLKRDLGEIGCFRAAERLLTVGFQKFIGKPGGSNSPVGQSLHKQTIVCAKAVLACARVAETKHAPAIHRLAIVEAFPTSFLGLMIQNPESLTTRRGNRSDVYYCCCSKIGGLDRLVARFLPGRTPDASFLSVTNHDDRAALVCALTALCVAGGQFTAVGDDEGWIILPPRDLIQPWSDWLAFATDTQ